MTSKRRRPIITTGDIRLSLAELGKHWDLSADIWGAGSINLADVEAAVQEQRFVADPFSPGFGSWSYDRHVERIAYLLHHGWTDAIEVDVGIPSLGFWIDWPIQEGNHRLLAALTRKDPFILASVAGEVDFIRKMIH